MALRGTADSQAGYFTASQAVEAGYADSTHGHQVARGSWERVLRGIYRLAGAPPHPWPELVVFSLWSRDRNGNPQGGYAGDTALALHRGETHPGSSLVMVVPRSFRKHAQTPAQLTLIKQNLPDEAWEERVGYRVLRAEWMDEEGLPLTAPRESTGRSSYDDIIDAGED